MSFFEPQAIEKYQFFKKRSAHSGWCRDYLPDQAKKKHKENLNLKGNVKKSEFEKKTPNFRVEN